MFYNKYNKKVGDFGEKIAVKFLEKRKYKIVDKNVKISYKELDIITKKDNLVIFFEVKTRTNYNFGGADSAITPYKIEHLKKAISMYVGLKKINANNIRLDLLVIDINKKEKLVNIKHYKDLF